MLERCLERSSELLAAGAYVHQYEAYGVTREHLAACIADLEQV
jgi:hypothetical protein